MKKADKNNQTVSIHELIIRYLESLEIEKNASKLTIRNYAHYLARFEAWLIQQKVTDGIEKVDLEIIRKYRLFLSRYKDKKEKNLSMVTQSYHMIALRSWFKWLVKFDFDVMAPEKIELPKGESRSVKFLKREQLERLMRGPDVTTKAGLRDRAILELLFSTGLRVSELTRLNRDKINFELREFGIIGKGGRARVVFLSDRAAIWLGKYFNTRKDGWKPAFIRYAREKLSLEADGEDKRLSVRGIQRVVEKYRKKTGVAVEITPHGLRHTFATDLLSHGAGLREVQEMLGHKNIATTQIYTHVTNPQLKKIHRRFHSGNKG